MPFHWNLTVALSQCNKGIIEWVTKTGKNTLLCTTNGSFVALTQWDKLFLEKWQKKGDMVKIQNHRTRLGHLENIFFCLFLAIKGRRKKVVWNFFILFLIDFFNFFFLDLLEFYSLKWLRLLIKVSKLTTEHQKWPKMSKKSILTFFCPKPWLEVCLRSGQYLVGVYYTVHSLGSIRTNQWK